MAWCGWLLLAVLAGCGSSGDAASTKSAESPPLVPIPKNLPAGTRIEFVHGFQRGYELAQQTGRPMMVFFTAPWCHYCHEMAAEAFVNPQVAELSQRFLCILVDADVEPDVCRQFGVRGYPTIQFLSPQGLPLNRVLGKRSAERLILEMQAALQATARRMDFTSGVMPVLR